MAGSPPKPAYVKVMLFIKKRPDITDEKFHSHWRDPHVQIAMANKKFMSKVRRYNQFHASPELKAQASEFGIPVLDFDGIAEVWVDSVEDWREVVSDPDFVKYTAGLATYNPVFQTLLTNVKADEAHFIQSPITLMFGFDNLVIGTDKKTGMEREIGGREI